MKRTADEMPLFTKTQDFLAWLVPLTNHFPRIHRQTITRRLIDAALDFQEELLTANTKWGSERIARLQQADAALNRVRLYIRLLHRWQWINIGQYEHASRLLLDMGNLLGGWTKQSKEVATTGSKQAGFAGVG